MERKTDAKERYDFLMSSQECSHDTPCPGIVPGEPEILSSLLEHLHFLLEGHLKSIALFVDEIVVFKINSMSTNLGRSLIDHINQQSSRSLKYAVKDILEFEAVASAWILSFVKTIK